MKRATHYARRIEAIEAFTCAQVDAVTDEIMRDLVRPFCDRHDLAFIGAMGGWCFYHPNGGQLSDAGHWCGMPLRIRLPKTMHTALNINDPTSNNDLGSILGEYRSPGYIARNTRST